MSCYDLYAKTELKISPKEYLRRKAAGDPAVENADFVPPRLGEKHFGYFLIKLDTPAYDYEKPRRASLPEPSYLSIF